MEWLERCIKTAMHPTVLMDLLASCQKCLLQFIVRLAVVFITECKATKFLDIDLEGWHAVNGNIRVGRNGGSLVPIFCAKPEAHSLCLKAFCTWIMHKWNWRCHWNPCMISIPFSCDVVKKLVKHFGGWFLLEGLRPHSFKSTMILLFPTIHGICSWIDVKNGCANHSLFMILAQFIVLCFFNHTVRNLFHQDASRCLAPGQAKSE